jgi:hypothetical protein
VYLDRTYDVSDVVSDDELAIRPPTFSMNNSFWYSLSYRNAQASLRDENPKVKEANSFQFADKLRIEDKGAAGCCANRHNYRVIFSMTS